MNRWRRTGTARNLSDSAQDVLRFLKERGASFFPDIVRETGKLKSEVETGLWELVAAGVVTADGFDNLRSLIDPKRRMGMGNGKIARPRHSAGQVGSVTHESTYGPYPRGGSYLLDVVEAVRSSVQGFDGA